MPCVHQDSVWQGLELELKAAQLREEDHAADLARAREAASEREDKATRLRKVYFQDSAARGEML